MSEENWLDGVPLGAGCGGEAGGAAPAEPAAFVAELGTSCPAAESVEDVADDVEVFPEGAAAISACICA